MVRRCKALHPLVLAVLQLLILHVSSDALLTSEPQSAGEAFDRHNSRDGKALYELILPAKLSNSAIRPTCAQFSWALAIMNNLAAGSSRDLLDEESHLNSFLEQWGIEDAPELKPDHGADKARFYQRNNEVIVNNHDAHQKAKQRQRDRHMADRKRYQKRRKDTPHEVAAEDLSQQGEDPRLDSTSAAASPDISSADALVKPTDEQNDASRTTRNKRARASIRVSQRVCKLQMTILLGKHSRPAFKLKQHCVHLGTSNLIFYQPRRGVAKSGEQNSKKLRLLLKAAKCLCLIWTPWPKEKALL